MIWSKDKKGKEKTFNFSRTTTRVTTSVNVNGKQVEMGPDVDLNDLVSQLQATGMSQDLINQAVESLQQVQSSADLTNTAHSQVKVTCSDCSRSVAYSKGNCIYCGAQLSLPDQNLTAAQSVDQEILSSEQSSVEQETAETAFINRLKDI